MHSDGVNKAAARSGIAGAEAKQVYARPVRARTIIPIRVIDICHRPL